MRASALLVLACVLLLTACSMPSVHVQSVRGDYIITSDSVRIGPNQTVAYSVMIDGEPGTATIVTPSQEPPYRFSSSLPGEAEYNNRYFGDDPYPANGFRESAVALDVSLLIDNDSSKPVAKAKVVLPAYTRQDFVAELAKNASFVKDAIDRALTYSSSETGEDFPPGQYIVLAIRDLPVNHCERRVDADIIYENQTIRVRQDDYLCSRNFTSFLCLSERAPRNESTLINEWVAVAPDIESLIQTDGNQTMLYVASTNHEAEPPCWW